MDRARTSISIIDTQTVGGKEASPASIPEHGLEGQDISDLLAPMALPALAKADSEESTSQDHPVKRASSSTSITHIREMGSVQSFAIETQQDQDCDADTASAVHATSSKTHESSKNRMKKPKAKPKAEAATMASL